MSLSVKTLECNAQCQSCYETEIRKNYNKRYNKKKIIETIKREMENYRQVTIHGGEPLLMTVRDLSDIMKVVYGKFKSTGIQTNLLLLKKQHIELFINYNTHVGISIDGDTIEMNEGRGYDPGPVIENIKLLKKHKIRMSAIIILRKYNCGTPKGNDNLIKFLKRLKNEFGIIDIRCNPGIVFDDHFREREELSSLDLGVVLIKLFNFLMDESEMMIQPVRDFIDGVMGFTDMTCSYGRCDPWRTGAEVTVMHDGSLGGCLKSGAALDGIAALRGDERSDVRSDILKQTDCKKCKYWHMCHGGCPGAAVDNDWRNKTRFCSSYLMVFSYIYKKLKNLFPNIYLLPDFSPEQPRKSWQSIRGSTWKKNEKMNIKKVPGEQKGKVDSKGHTDEHEAHHGDKEHGDSNDPAWRKAHGWAPIKGKQERKKKGKG